jgi:hypothetical protein
MRWHEIDIKLTINEDMAAGNTPADTLKKQADAKSAAGKKQINDAKKLRQKSAVIKKRQQVVKSQTDLNGLIAGLAKNSGQ